MSFADQEPTADTLMDEAFEFLESHEFEAALEVGNRLCEMRWSGGFEIRAKAQAGLGNLDEACAILDEGVATCPDVWILWVTLGIYRSDSGDYPGAHEALERALECPKADLSAIHLNIAIVLGREERFAEALAQLQDVTDDHIQSRAAAHRSGYLLSLGRSDEALDVAEKALREADESTDCETLSLLHEAVAEALFRAKGDNDNSFCHVSRAIELDSRNTRALWLLRELRNERSAGCQYLRILAEGQWNAPLEDEEGIPRFVATYDVVAESPEEALIYIRELEPEGVRDTVRIAECRVIEGRPDGPKGVYRKTGYCFWVP